MLPPVDPKTVAENKAKARSTSLIGLVVVAGVGAMVAGSVGLIAAPVALAALTFALANRN